VVEGGPELVELLLGDSLAVPGQDLVLNLVDGSKEEIIQVLENAKIYASFNFNQCCGSGSGLDPGSMGSLDPDPNSQSGVHLKLKCNQQHSHIYFFRTVLFTDERA
jgi:hypothetical protein